MRGFAAVGSRAAEAYANQFEVSQVVTSLQRAVLAAPTTKLNVSCISPRLLLPRTSFANTFFATVSAKMPKPSPQPIEVKRPVNIDWVAVAAEKKQKLMESRRQSQSVRPVDMSSSEHAPGQDPQQEQPTSDRHEPFQTRNTTVAGARSIPGQPRQLPADGGTHAEASQPNKPSTSLNTPDKSSTNGSTQGTPCITQTLMESLRDVNDAKRDSDAPSSANDHTAAKVEEKTDDGARDKVQRGDNSTSRKEVQASHGSAKSTVVLKDKPNAQSAAEEGEITGEPSAPLRKIPVHESTRQPASSKKTPPTRGSTVTSIAPTDQDAKRRVSGSLEATPESKHRGPAGAGYGAPSSASRSGGRHEQGRARHGRQDYDAQITWEAYRPPSSAHHTYTRPSREQRPRSASPLATRPIEEREWETLGIDPRDPDLQEWLRLTGWYKPAWFRQKELFRLRRLQEIELEKVRLRKEGERDKAEVQGELGEPASEARYQSDTGHRPLTMPLAPPRRTEDVEPPEHRMLGRYPVTAGTKRERGEESDGDADGGFSKYPRTNRNSRGSRAGSHGYHHSGREDLRHWQDREDRRRSGRLSPSRFLRDSPPPRYSAQRHSNQGFRSPAGHPLPRDDYDGEHETGRYVTRDRQPPRHRPHWSSSSPPNGRGYKSSGFHKSEYGRLR